MATDPDGTFTLKQWAQIVICLIQLKGQIEDPGDVVGKYTKLPTGGQQSEQSMKDCGDYCRKLIKAVAGAGKGGNAANPPPPVPKPFLPEIPRRPSPWSVFIIPPAVWIQLWNSIGGGGGIPIEGIRLQ